MSAFRSLLRLVAVVVAILAGAGRTAGGDAVYGYGGGYDLLGAVEAADVTLVCLGQPAEGLRERDLDAGDATTTPRLFFVAPNRVDDLLDQARSARDTRASETGRRTATATGGYDPATGRVVSGCSSNPTGCAELDVVRQLDIDPSDVRFTEAIRPRTGQEVPICPVYQGQFSPSQFPPGVRSDPAGPWGQR